MNSTKTIKNFFGIVLFSVAASAARTECCTIYSETNMKGEKHDLCYEGHNKDYVTDATVYNIKGGDIVTWEAKSIECTDNATWTPCSASTSKKDCQSKAFSVYTSSYGHNADISSVDTSQIAIYHNSNHIDDGHAFTVYENDDCTGASYSPWDLLDVNSFYKRY